MLLRNPGRGSRAAVMRGASEMVMWWALWLALVACARQAAPPAAEYPVGPPPATPEPGRPAEPEPAAGDATAGHGGLSSGGVTHDEGRSVGSPRRALVPGEATVERTRVYFVGKFGGAPVTRLGQLDLPGGVTTAFPLSGIDGGPSGALGASLSPDGSLLLVLGRSSAHDTLALHAYDLRASEAGPRVLYAASSPAIRHNGLALLSPDGRLVVFSATIEGGAGALYVVPSTGGSAPRRVGPLTTVGRYAWAPGAPATLVFLYVSDAGRTLWSVDAARPGAEPVPLAPSAVGWSWDFDAAGNVLFAWTPRPPGTEGLEGLDGTLYAVPVAGGQPRQLAQTVAHTIAASPDRRRVAFGGTDGSVRVLDGQRVRKLATLPERYVAGITWSADATRLAVRACPNGYDGGCGLYVLPASGQADPVRLFAGAYFATFTPDSRMVLAVSDAAAPMRRELYGTADLTTADPGLAGTRLQDAVDGYIYYGFTRPLPAVEDRAAGSRAPGHEPWRAFAFGYDRAQSACTGGARYVLHRPAIGKWIGVELCSPTRYKIFAGESREGVFHEIGDFAGHGQDHCELVSPGFRLPDEDDVTSGGCATCAVEMARRGNPGPVPVYTRSRLGEPLKLQTWPEHNLYTSLWYECGVAIP